MGDSHTWIDVIYTDDDNVVLNANNIMPTFPNSHDIIDVELDFQIVKPTILNSFSYRDFKSITSEELIPLLASCDWSPLHSNGVDLQLEHLSQNIMSVIDKLAPLKEFRPLEKVTLLG